ncbi:D-alanyl-D-alanine carboxypeptidase family protein [Promicromonospora thailandica]|uniref:D-alanyl-D-alanine carboxypeptidase n=1 Tax=Promicromonospora thailandica TaxID=765201 RepID=A0A9X2G3K0_9MICO|nr:M15 family metallopeptidase [Promicromonospora thailandica]MCP2265145.1 D-alanyl-D-alanine carboxypeptidase [Promicromonospora thailandica]BFF19782.1 hypothetical protein GCM10025730_33030 [Promicromonospora thailandica]
MSDEAKKAGPGFLRTFSHAVPGSYRLVASRGGLRGLLRTVGTGAVAAGIAAAVLFTASASVPGSGQPGDGGAPPIRLYGLVENVSVGETVTAPDGVTLSQIVAVLERAEQMAQEQGAAFSPAVAQAAAELGMLYTTYQMQQLAFGENNEGLRIEDAPVARGSVADDDADTPAGKDADKHPDTDADKAPDKDADRDADNDTDEESGANDPAPEDSAPAVEVSHELTSVIDPHDADPTAGYVTYDQVVIAAVRLANMLDPSVPNALVEVEGTEREGFSLRESLLDVVDIFGGSTLGYANGRIPTDVLCPLEFAPGHMLRCDAAERLTALSAEFEKEFGYPIPMTDSYRSYEMQVTLAGIKPHLAAVPGTSNHGWGLAVDLGNPIAGGHSAEYVWMRLHGPDYGWDNPSWARLDGAKPEPWHFEFFAAGSIPNRAIDPSDVGTWTPGDPDDSATPHYKPPVKPKPGDGGSKDKPDTKPSDRPGDNPPSQKPTKPTPKPTPDPSPTKPGDPTKPDDPSKPPTPTPTPTPTPSEPSPSPSPSEPEPSPSPSNPGTGTPPECEDEDPDATEKTATETATDEKTATDEDASEGDTGAGDGSGGEETDDPCTDDSDEDGAGDGGGTSTTSTPAAKQPDDEELDVVDDGTAG